MLCSSSAALLLLNSTNIPPLVAPVGSEAQSQRRRRYRHVRRGGIGKALLRRAIARVKEGPEVGRAREVHITILQAVILVVRLEYHLRD